MCSEWGGGCGDQAEESKITVFDKRQGNRRIGLWGVMVVSIIITQEFVSPLLPAVPGQVSGPSEPASGSPWEFALAGIEDRYYPLGPTLLPIGLRLPHQGGVGLTTAAQEKNRSTELSWSALSPEQSVAWPDGPAWGWYRTRFPAPAALPTGGYRLCLGRVGDAAVLFVNGLPIARHGVFRPQKPEEPLPFACCLPARLLQPGAANEIAVQVYREQAGVAWEFAPSWEPLASAGAEGKRGKEGERGEATPSGAEGKEGKEGERGEATPSQGRSDTNSPTHQPTTPADLHLTVVSDRQIVSLGQQDLPVTLRFTNPGGRAARIGSVTLALWQDGIDVSEHYLVWQKTPPPAAVPPGGMATQEFLVDTFDDTPPSPPLARGDEGAVEVRPRVVWCDAAADLLTNGSFEPDGPDPSRAWQPGPDLKGEGAAVRVVRSQEAERRIVKVATPPYDFHNTGDLCADGAASLKITPGPGAPPPAPPSQGGEGFRTVFESQPVPVEPGQVYVLGGQSYNGAELRVVELDAAGKVVAERGKTFGVEWDPIVHAWTSVRLAWLPQPETVAVRVQLRSVAEVNWWDGLYLVPAERLWTYEWSESPLVWEVQARREAPGN